MDLAHGVSAKPAVAPRPATVEITADAIRASLARHAGIKDCVWRELGLPSRFALHRRLQRYAITDEPD